MSWRDLLRRSDVRGARLVTADAERLAAIRARLESAPQDLRWGAPVLLEDIAYLLSVAAERDAEKERADEVRAALIAAGLAGSCSVADLIRHHRTHYDTHYEGTRRER